MQIYSPDSTKVVHNTSVDFKKRCLSLPIHIVQYDHSLPILAVSLNSGGNTYTLPNNVEANIRLKKPDGKVVYNPVLGCNNERNVLYVEITYQMTTCWGRTSPVIEIVIDTDVVASSSIDIEIDKNPIQVGDIESTDEVKTLIRYVQEAEEARDDAAESELAAKASENAAKASELAAKTSETNAGLSESSAASSALSASTSASNAANSATAANASKVAAKTSEDNAKVSETNANASKVAAKTSEDNAKVSETNANASKVAAKTSEDNAKVSETNAANSASSAATSASNAETYKNNASTSATNAANSASAANASKNAAKTSEDNAKESENNAAVSESNASDSASAALAAAQRAEIADVGQLMESLAKHEMTIAITDSTDDSLLDSSGNSILATIMFIDMEDVKGLAEEICYLRSELEDIRQNGSFDERVDGIINEIGSLTTILTAAVADINKLKSNALLDSGY